MFLLLEFFHSFKKSRFRISVRSQKCGLIYQIYRLWKTSKSGYLSPLSFLSKIEKIKGGNAENPVKE
jgi:hypothetical protein